MKKLKVLLLPTLTRGKESLSCSWRRFCLMFCRRSMWDWYDQRRWWNLKYHVLASSVWLEGVSVEERKWEHLRSVCVCS